MIIFVLIISYGCTCVFGSQNYNPHQYHVKTRNQSSNALDRMILSMRTYIEDGILRTQELNPIRWTYEDSVEYEIGYIIGDVIERYKKLIEEAHRAQVINHPYLRNHVIQLIFKLETVQKLYFEVYHLARMMHEIPEKFKYTVVTTAPDMAALKVIQDLEAAQKQIDEIKKKREAKKKLIKRMTRPGYTGTTLASDEINSKPYNVWWPRDYGWELDAYGW